MDQFRTLALILAGLALGRCSSSPSDPVNNTLPIREMDGFFRSFSGETEARAPYAAPSPEYAHEPGYAPAYPPYQP